MPPPTQENKALLAPLKSERKDILELIQSDTWKEKFRQVIPKHLTVDRLLRTAITAMSRNPDLLKCTQVSLTGALMKCTASGLEPDGYYAHLIPFWNSKINAFEAAVIFDYKGLRDLAHRSGAVKKINGAVVYAGDEFDYELGSHAFLRHRPTKNAAERGDVIAAYSYVRMTGGEDTFDVMLVEDIERIRKRSKSPNKGPWVDDWCEMAKKTVFRRHSKELPLSAEFRDVVRADDDGAAIDIDAERVPAPKAILDKPKQLPSGKTEIVDDGPPLDDHPADKETKKEPPKPGASAEPPKTSGKPASAAATGGRTGGATPPTGAKPEEPPGTVHALKAKLHEAGITEAEFFKWAHSVQDESFKVPGDIMTIDQLDEGGYVALLENFNVTWFTIAEMIRNERKPAKEGLLV